MSGVHIDLKSMAERAALLEVFFVVLFVCALLSFWVSIGVLLWVPSMILKQPKLPQVGSKTACRHAI